MKTLSAYFHETNKLYEFRIKMAHVEPKGEVLDRIKSALNAFKVESVTTAKRLPITEHWEFANEGACECYVFDVTLRYPTIPGQLRQLIGERAGINANWVCVRTMAEALNEELSFDQADDNAAAKVALLNTEELGSIPSNEAQKYVGNNRFTDLIKELSGNTRKFDIAGNDTTIGGEKDPSYGKTTNDTTGNNKSPLGK
jgi:hypothetical protein